MPSIEFNPEKRRTLALLRDLTLSAAALTVLPNCGPIKAQEDEETVRGWERKERPEEGDVIYINNSPYLLRSGKRYPIPDIDRFVEYTKFTKYRGRVFREPRFSIGLNSLPLGEVPQEPAVIDPFTGDIKNNKRFGGETNIFIGGFLRDAGGIDNTSDPRKDTFLFIRKGLEQNNWQDFDNLFFNYGQSMTGRYETKDTAKDPVENIKHALEFMQALKEEFPLVQFNLIAHSLGGIFALACAMEHWDAINNLILVNSPVRGFSGDDCQKKGSWILKQGLRLSLGIDEKVTDYLFTIWNNKIYQREIEDFAGFFRRIGKRLVVIFTEDDQIVLPESAIIENAETIRIVGDNNEDKEGKCPVSIFPFPVVDIPGVEAALHAHGAPLTNGIVRNHIKERLGQNLAKAA